MVKSRKEEDPLLPMLIWLFVLSVTLSMILMWATTDFSSRIRATILTSEMDRRIEWK